jgi:soluble lytic murein transglycosylase
MGDSPQAAALEPSVAETLESGLRRVDVLSALGVRGELVREVERLRGVVEGRAAAEYALAEALIDRGNTVTAIGIGWDLRRRTGAWNPRLLRIVYPFPFRSMIEPEAQRLELDPYLVAGLIRQESAFSPTVTSSAGAIGLMQVMPETGGMLAGDVGLRDYDPELLRQPDVNVHLGTRYLSTMLERYDGVLPLVLSAYNAGPTRAARWRSLPEARDPELFIERVPYRETRDYIRHVLTNRAIYRALYPDLRPSGG